MGHRKRKVKATTNNLTKGIINHLKSTGHDAWRIQNTGIPDFSDGQLKLRKLPDEEKGKFDIYACLAPSGKSLWIDVKTGSDTPSPFQLSFKERIERAGGIAVFIKTYQQYLEWYERYKKSS